MLPSIVSSPTAASADEALGVGDMQRASLSEGQSDYGLRTSSTIDIPDPIAQALTQHAHAARGAYVPNIERALSADIAIFTLWCLQAGVGALLATPATVAAFIDAMATVKAPATIRRYLSSITTFHGAGGLHSPSQDQLVRLALKRLHQTYGRAQVQASPLTRDLVDRRLAAANLGLMLLTG